MRFAQVPIVAALACVTALPAVAQPRPPEPPWFHVVAPRGWLGFSYDPVARPGQRSPVVIREVLDDSPAKRAGFLPGDTLLEVNGINATQALLASLGSALEPGDTVRVKVRRDGRDRLLTLQAAERPAGHTYVNDGRYFIISPDSIRGRLRMLTDSLRTYADTSRFPNIYIEKRDGRPPVLRLPDSSYVMSLDSLTRGVMRYYGPGDSLRVHVDSIWRRVAPAFNVARFHADSLFRFHADSLFRFHPDSFRFDAGHIRFYTDSLHQFAPFVATWPAVGALGGRAIAGAELAELTPGLARHFDAQQGVLVMRVPEHTPAHGAGLAEADVIVRANGTEVSSITELRRIIARADPSAPVRLEVIRDRKRVTLEMKRS